jgi:hypothetical protein
VAKATRWAVPDAKTRQHGEQTGLETLVVHAVNDASWVFGLRKQPGYRSQHGKLAAWGVRSQD